MPFNDMQNSNILISEPMNSQLSASDLIQQVQITNSDDKTIIMLIGAKGTGKSTLAKQLARILSVTQKQDELQEYNSQEFYTQICSSMVVENNVLMDTSTTFDLEGTDYDEFHIKNMVNYIKQASKHVNAIIFVYDGQNKKCDTINQLVLKIFFASIGHEAINNIGFVFTNLLVNAKAQEKVKEIKQQFTQLGINIPDNLQYWYLDNKPRDTLLSLGDNEMETEYFSKLVVNKEKQRDETLNAIIRWAKGLPKYDTEYFNYGHYDYKAKFDAYYKKQLDAKEAEIKEYKKQLEDKVANIQQKQIQITQLNSDIQSLKTQNEQLTVSLQSTINAYQAQINQLINTINTKTAEIENLISKVKDSQQQIKQYMQKIIRLKGGVVNQQYNWNEIITNCNNISNLNNLNYLQKTILKIYNKYINGIQSSLVRHNCYQFVKYLLEVQIEQFQLEFLVYNDPGIDMLVKLVGEYQVNNLTELRMKVNIAKHVEDSQITIQLSNDFKLDDIPDDVVINMLSNIDNRIQLINGPYYFIIICRVADNRIFKTMIDSDYYHSNQQKIEEMLQQCDDGELYDVIINSDKQYENLGPIRIRYLNYYNINVLCRIEITLSHPEDLVSASLRRVQIANVNQCSNLTNFDCWDNIYTKQSMESLYSLKRVFSTYDEYHGSNACLLSDLFQNNKLEYVYICNNNQTSNVLNSFTITRNAENLRYVNIYQENATYTIKLDVSKSFPENLTVYSVETKEGGTTIRGGFAGTENRVAQIRQKICHVFT